jgi:hypothetical protein
MQKELEKLHVNFQTQYLLFWLCTFPFNVKMPHLRKNNFWIKKSNGYCSWNLQYWFLPYESRGILQRCSFKSILTVWYLTLNSKWRQHFLGFVSTHAPTSCNFSSIPSSFLLSFYSAGNMVFEILPLLCILWFYKALMPQDIFLQNTCQHFFNDAYFVKALQINTIWSTA